MKPPERRINNEILVVKELRRWMKVLMFNSSTPACLKEPYWNAKFIVIDSCLPFKSVVSLIQYFLLHGLASFKTILGWSEFFLHFMNHRKVKKRCLDGPSVTRAESSTLFSNIVRPHCTFPGHNNCLTDCWGWLQWKDDHSVFFCKWVASFLLWLWLPAHDFPWAKGSLPRELEFHHWICK